jgi:ferric-dicitrate binding protein FerR (iron transport regulator)
MKKRGLSGSYQIASLIHKHLDKSITPAEHALLEEWLYEKESNQELFQQLVKKEHISQAITRLIQIEEEKAAAFPHILQRLQAPEAPQALVSRFRKWHYAAAAGILLCACTATVFFISRQGRPVTTTPAISAQKHDIPPGSNKAILRLGDGTTITLDSAQNGTLAQQGQMKVIKLDSGRLAYQGNSGSTGRDVLYNTVFTPRGGQYRIMLPDGSQAWLNAASSLRFPTVFAAGERKVEVSGEVYFEVAAAYTSGKKKAPFIVEVKNTSGAANGRIEVLGTHFNIMAYDEEKAVAVTLLEGAVKVSGNSSQARLQPGQQAQLNRQGAISVLPDADLAAVMAWKNGLFQFQHADLPAVLRQLCRWYDVDVEYRGAIPPREFIGEIQRDLSLLQVLRILEKNQVHISIEGRKLIVMP